MNVVGLEQLSGHGMGGETGTLASDAGVDLKQNDPGWPADYCKSTARVGKNTKTIINEFAKGQKMQKLRFKKGWAGYTLN